MAALINYSSPAEKTHALMQAQDLLSRDMGADVLLPLLIYTLIYHPPESLIAQLRFIQAYRRPGGLGGAAEYCITNLVASIAYIDTFDLPSLGIYETESPASPFKLDPKDSPSSTSSFSNSLKSLSTLPIDMTGEGVRALTGVMDMVVGRFWSTSYNGPPLPPRHSDTASSSHKSSSKESLIPRNESLDYFFKKKFLDSSFENLTIADLQELLEDYKKLEKMINH
ncbi:hypothetical protein DSO57_1009204 [Entomophthora muscae]|uniref:Uncharacterized protein n=1 Tax=Entomophthora muscae TaxID=34485 RepID=A0ACC2SVP1_9FUNG|nr:hypothetical protein DSO57_1009204 [Entomophthora muscae]